MILDWCRHSYWNPYYMMIFTFIIWSFNDPPFTYAGALNIFYFLWISQKIADDKRNYYKMISY